MEQARLAGVPAPAVLLVDEFIVDGANLPVMVQELVPGIALADRLGLTPTDRRRALVNAGAVLARLNSVPTPGLWRPEADGTWAGRDWDTLMTGWVDDRGTEKRFGLPERVRCC